MWFDYLKPLAGVSYKSSQKACNLRPHGASDSHSKQTGDHGTISPRASLFVPPATVDFAILDSSANYLELLSDVADLAGASSQAELHFRYLNSDRRSRPEGRLHGCRPRS